MIRPAALLSLLALLVLVAAVTAATPRLVNDYAVRVLIVKTQEDWMIAQECWKLAHRGG